MTELSLEVKKNNYRKINDLASGSAKSLIYKEIRKTVILRFLRFFEPFQLGCVSCPPLMDLDPILGSL